MMIFKFILVALLILMIFNLFKALKVMNSDAPDKPPMSQFIGRRLLFSVAIVALVIIGVATGLIEPNHMPR